MGKSKAIEISGEEYNNELKRMQRELVMLQEWIRNQGKRVVVVFEGRDAAGKGGMLRRITEKLNARVCKIIALGVPTEREKTQWYFQRYVEHLPAAGEMVLFDRSWYNRAGVERVMGFCADAEYKEFLYSCPQFERMLTRSGIILIKYWLSVSAKEQEKRFKDRIKKPSKNWKLSPIDLDSYVKWDAYSEAKDRMLNYTDIKEAPWFVVPSDNKKIARLNCIHHLLSQFDYEKIEPIDVELPEKSQSESYIRMPSENQTIIPEIYQ